jgi:hypothetical protein
MSRRRRRWHSTSHSSQQQQRPSISAHPQLLSLSPVPQAALNAQVLSNHLLKSLQLLTKSFTASHHPDDDVTVRLQLQRRIRVKNTRAAALSAQYRYKSRPPGKARSACRGTLVVRRARLQVIVRAGISLALFFPVSIYAVCCGECSVQMP